MQLGTFTLQRVLSGKTFKAWRVAHNLSANDLAVELGVSRQYVKSIEGGSLLASQKIIKKFDELRERVGESIAVETEPKAIHVVSRFEMPQTV